MNGFLKICGLILLLWSGLTRAEEPVIPISMLGDDPLLIGRYVSFWETGPVIPADAEVLSGAFDTKFEVSTQELPARGFLTGNIWVRLTIDNTELKSRELYLNSRFALLDAVTLYQKNTEQNFVGETQGDSPPGREGYADYRVPSFKLHVAPGRNSFYIKVVTQGSTVLALYLATPEAHQQYRLADSVLLGLFFGVMLTLFLYNSFLTISFRSVTYFYYSMFLLMMGFTQLSLQGCWPMILPGRLGAYAQNSGFAISSCFTILAATLVTIHFLNMREHMPRIYRVYQSFIVASWVLFSLIFVLDYNTHIKLMSGYFFVASVTMLVFSSLAVVRGYRPAFAYTFAWCFMIISNVFIFLTFEGISHIPIFVQWSNMPGVICEGILMSLALGDRVNFFREKADRTIHHLNDELQKHLIQVEALVDERTETIRTIVDNVTSGFLVIDQQGKIAPGFTRSCRLLLGRDLREGENLLDILNLRPALERKFRMALRQIFEDQMPLEVTLGQLPVHLHCSGKYLHMDASGLRDKQGTLQQLLLTLTDATELRKRKIEAHRNRSLLKTLRDIEGFRQFVSYSYDAIQKLRQLPDSSRELSFILHTLKGNCLVFHLPDLAHALHRLESKPHVTSTDLDKLEDQFKKYLTRNAGILRIAWGPATHEMRVTGQQLAALQELAQHRSPGPVKTEIDLWIRDVAAKPIRSILQPLINDARVVARKLNKEIDMRVVDRDARVHSEAEEILIDELIHIVRNAIVHGIEDDRELVEKPRQGFVCLDFRELDNGLAISCSDDGRGFDRQLWEAEWVKRGLPVTLDLKQLPLVELISGVSRGGFSTQEKVSLYAGRGIGIEALFAAVERCQGTIEVFSESGKGCRFEIFIPRSQSLRSVS